MPIFAIPGQNGEQAAQRGNTGQGLFKSAKSQFSRILNKFHNIITQKAKAQTVAENVKTLLSKNKCVSCDLIGANLSFANLTGATWCDGICTCADPSIGTCVGCASQDTCTGSL